MANDYAKKHAIRVAQAHREVEAIEHVLSALGPLTPFQRNKVWRMLMIAFEQEPKRKHTS